MRSRHFALGCLNSELKPYFYWRHKHMHKLRQKTTQRSAVKCGTEASTKAQDSKRKRRFNKSKIQRKILSFLPLKSSE